MPNRTLEKDKKRFSWIQAAQVIYQPGKRSWVAANVADPAEPVTKLGIGGTAALNRAALFRDRRHPI
jgi:hypothetical protein